jgi:hypothetical protein
MCRLYSNLGRNWTKITDALHEDLHVILYAPRV